MAEPKYVEILGELRTRCALTPPGSKLTPERALAQEFGVSVMTLRHSLAKLAEEGWIRRTPGSGTFVARPTVTMGPTLTSFSEDMRRLGLHPSAKVIRFEHIPPDLDTVNTLMLRPGEKAVLLERLRYAGGEPMCHELAVFPGRLASAFEHEDLAASMHEMLAKSGVVPHSTLRRVRAVVAPARESELLLLPRDSPALEIVDTFSDAEDKPFQHVRSRYRFDRYEVLSRIDRLQATPAATATKAV